MHRTSAGKKQKCQQSRKQEYRQKNLCLIGSLQNNTPFKMEIFGLYGHYGEPAADSQLNRVESCVLKGEKSSILFDRIAKWCYTTGQKEALTKICLSDFGITERSSSGARAFMQTGKIPLLSRQPEDSMADRVLPLQRSRATEFSVSRVEPWNVYTSHP